MKKTLYILFCFIICSAACSRGIYRCGNLDIFIPAGINIEEKEIRSRLTLIPLEEGSALTLRITVYGYSRGAEIINFSEGNNFSTSMGRAWMKALIQVRHGAEIVRADFIEIQGNSRDELLDGFASRVMEIYGQH